MLDVTIIPREERVSDPLMLYVDHPEYQRIQTQRAEREIQQKALQRTNPQEYKAQQQEAEEKERKSRIRYEYLMQNFADFFAIQSSTTGDQQGRFWRTQSFAKNKTQIIIHHTALDARTIQNTRQERLALQKIHSFHSFQRQWGDIWYNFIIGPSGNIYEWRAGGIDVVGAHSKYNNTPSIGIALMGNFDIHETTPEQRESLEALTVELALLYNIDPYASLWYHQESTEHPYIRTHEHHSIAGHKDSSKTACPWSKLYNKLPHLKQVVHQQQQLSHASKDIPEPQIQQITSRIRSIHYDHTWEITPKQKELYIPYPSSTSHHRSTCIIRDNKNKKSIQAQCTKQKDILQITSTKPIPYGEIILIRIHQDNTYDLLHVRTQASTRIQATNHTKPTTRKEKKQEYIEKYQPTLLTEATQKKKTDIFVHEIDEYSKQPVRVLLRELSFMDSYHAQCSQTCSVHINQKQYETKDLQRKKSSDWSNTIIVSIDDTEYQAPSMLIDSQWGHVQIINYDRSSYTGVPRNSFVWKLHVQEQPYTDLQWQTYKEIMIVNELSLDEYMRGVVESNDTQTQTHNEVLSLLAKNYMLFYMHPDHIHPSIPWEAKYNAIDDPEYFQYFVGAWLEKTLSKRPIALQATKDMILSYENTLAFSPYFSCSWWFTRSAREKRWRTDTPYLISQEDPYPCKDFLWHGVWLSGRGAEYLAKQGRQTEEIIEYYYPWVQLSVVQYSASIID